VIRHIRPCHGSTQHEVTKQGAPERENVVKRLKLLSIVVSSYRGA
jgi:hypothetical protein